MPSRLLRVRTGRHPHEIAILSASAIIGILGILFPENISNSVTHVLPWPWALIFWGVLASFAFVTLWGVFNSKIEGLLVERAGLIVVTIMYGIFIYCVLSYAGIGGAVSAILPGAYLVGNIARCIQIRRDLVLLKSYLTDHPGEIVR